MCNACCHSFCLYPCLHIKVKTQPPARALDDKALLNVMAKKKTNCTMKRWCVYTCILHILKLSHLLSSISWINWQGYRWNSTLYLAKLLPSNHSATKPYGIISRRFAKSLTSIRNLSPGQQMWQDMSSSLEWRGSEPRWLTVWTKSNWLTKCISYLLQNLPLIKQHSYILNLLSPPLFNTSAISVANLL